MKIRLANDKDIIRVVEITNACANHMINQNIFQWDENYPSQVAFNEDVHNNSLYVIEKNNDILGCLCISAKIDDVYKNVKWLTLNERNIYLHRLAIHPDHQGKGIAREIMDFAEEFALKNNYDSIRLDTFSQNPRNQKFYLNRGYIELGSVYLKYKKEYSYICYEMLTAGLHT